MLVMAESAGNTVAMVVVGRVRAARGHEPRPHESHL
jgi:hypothetical protein